MKIGIVGMGLIGGSLALKLALKGLSVVGFARNPEAFEGRSVPSELKIAQDIFELEDCKVVFLCTPLNALCDTFSMVQDKISAETLLTDVGSIKGFICDHAANNLRSDCRFIGGHPMAGSEKAGFANANPELFCGCKWVLMSGDPLLEKIVAETGAEVLITDPESHDRAVALISHLPALVSQALLANLNSWPEAEVACLAAKLASTGFQSMTRLARGNPELNYDLTSMNHKFIIEACKSFDSHIHRLLNEANKFA